MTGNEQLSVDTDAALTHLEQALAEVRSIAAHTAAPPPIPAATAGRAFADYGAAINDLVHAAHHTHMTTLRHSEATLLAARDTITTIANTDNSNAQDYRNHGGKGTRQ